MVNANAHGVVILTKYWKKSQGGGVKEFLIRLTNEFENDRIEYHVVFMEGEDLSNCKIEGSRLLFPIRALFYLKNNRPQVVHSQGTWFMLLPGYLWKQLNGTRLIHTAHSAPERPSLIEKVLMRFLMERCDMVTFLSNNMKQRLDDAYGMNLKNGLKIDPGAVFRSVGDDEVRAFKAEHKIGEDRIILLGQALTAHPAKYEGVKRLIQALKILIDIHPEIVLVLSREGVYTTKLRKFARDQGLSDYVYFVGDLDDPLVAVKACHIFTHITMDEGLGLAIIEAMSLGKPIVASRVGGIPETIIDRQNGLLVGEEPSEIADAIDYLIRNKEVASRMGEKARLSALDRYDWSRTATVYKSLYFPNDDS